MVQQSKPWRADSFIKEYLPCPGTLRSTTREVTDEPCTKNSTGNAGSPGLGALSRLRDIHSATSPFLAQYSLLQISPASEGCADATCPEPVPAAAIMPALTPRLAPFSRVRRASLWSRWAIFRSPMAGCMLATSLADRHPDCETTR